MRIPSIATPFHALQGSEGLEKKKVENASFKEIKSEVSSLTFIFFKGEQNE